MSSKKTSLAWCFTLNNPTTLPDFSATEGLTKVRYAVFQEELGESGTYHLQGYVEFTRAVRLGFCKRLIVGAHFEPRRGTAEEARAYCMKTEGRIDGPYEYGTFTPSSQGKRSDLLACKESLDAGATMTSVSESFFSQFIRYSRGFALYRTLHQARRNFKTLVELYVGPTGSGKSACANLLYPLAYWKQRSNWWDGYDYHREVIIDEFYGWLPFDMLLRLLDRYPLLVETKGGQTEFVARKVCITSNKVPTRWYNRGISVEPLLRRIDRVVQFTDINKDPVEFTGPTRWVEFSKISEEFFQDVIGMEI